MPSMIDIIVTLVLVLILGGALWYIRRAKKRGVRCIGCPEAGNCAKRQNGEACERKDEEKQ